MYLLNIIMNIVWIILLDINCWPSLKRRLDPAAPRLQKEFRKQRSFASFGCFLRLLSSQLLRIGKNSSKLPPWVCSGIFKEHGTLLQFHKNGLLWSVLTPKIQWQYPFAYENSNYTVTLCLFFYPSKAQRRCIRCEHRCQQASNWFSEQV